MTLATIYSRDELNQALAASLPEQLVVFAFRSLSGQWSGHVVHIADGCGKGGYADDAFFDEADAPLRRAMAMAKQLAGWKWLTRDHLYFTAN